MVPFISYLDSGVPDDVIQNALAGFYFNSAKQRTVWAAERLLRAFISAICPRSMRRRSAKGTAHPRRMIIQAAERTLVHVQQAHGDKLDSTTAVLQAHRERGDFHWLHEDVNARKDSLYPDPAIKAAADRPEREQVRMASSAHGLLVDSYVELLAWSPAASRRR